MPRAYANNTPERLRAVYLRHRARFPEFPLGSDFTPVEETLLRALTWLRAHVRPVALLEMARTGPVDADTRAKFAPELERMGLDSPDSLRQKLYQQLLLKALEANSD